MRRVVVIGLDGLSWNVLEELFSRGVMGNVDNFRKKGVYGELDSLIPPFTAPRWTSLSTGVNPGKHGAYAVLMPTEDYHPRLASSRDVRYPRVYEVCTMQGLNSVVINLPLSYPPVVLKGMMISDWLYPRYEVFPEKARDLAKDYAPYDPLWAKRDLADYVRTMFTGLERRLAVIRSLFLKTEWSLFFVVFSETDFLLHKMYDNILSGEGLSEEAYKVFNLIDSFIGWVVRNSPRDSLIFLVSDHGFTAYEHVVRVNKILQDAGLVKLKVVERKGQSQKELRTPKRKIYLPKFLYRWATRVEPVRKMLSSLFHALFGRSATPIYTTALDIPSSLALMHDMTHFGIYLNSKDIFRNGLIESKEVGNAVNFVKSLLINVKNPITGENVFERVYAKKELFQGPYVKRFPHVILLSREEYWVAGHTKGEIVEENRQVNHSLAGIFAVCGQDVRRGVELDKISILDIVPSILHFLELPIPHDTDGRVLLEIFNEDSQAKQGPVRKEDYLERWKVTRKAKILPRRREEGTRYAKA